MWRKGNLHPLLVGMQIGTASMEKGIEILQKTNNRVAMWPEIPLLGVYLDKNIIQKDTRTNVHCSTFYNSPNKETI